MGRLWEQQNFVMFQRLCMRAASQSKHSSRARQSHSPAPKPLLGHRSIRINTPTSIYCPIIATSATERHPRRRGYYTASSPTVSPYPPTEAAILSAAHTHIPTTGFTTTSLVHGATDAGYLTASINLFPRGAFDLVLYHLVTSRLALKDLVQFPTPEANSRPLSTTAKVRALLLARLRANDLVIHNLPEALGQMSLLGNIPASVAELARLVDEIWYLAGDVSVDSSWYTKRGMLAGVYASAEVYMTQDKSPGYRDTEEFVDRRLEEVRSVGAGAGATLQWIGFTGLSTVNILRSWGVRI